MFTYESKEFEQELIKELEYVVKTFRLYENLIYSELPLESLIDDEVETEDDEDEVHLGWDTIIDLHPDEAHSDDEIYVQVSIKEFVDIMRLFRTVKTFTQTKCTTPSVAFYYVNTLNKYYVFMDQFVGYNGFKNDILLFNTEYKSKKIKCSLVRGITLFGLKILESDNYYQFPPPVSSEDIFIKIEGENLLDEDFDSIANAYIFELSACDVIDLSIESRPIDFDLGEDAGDKLNTENIRELPFGKGISEIIKLYNKAVATNDIDAKIVNFVKVIEHASETVIRLEKTELLQCKLNSLRALKADANYIKELEQIINEFNDEYGPDSAKIKATIIKCCDLYDLCDIAPKYLKLSDLKEQQENEKCNKQDFIKKVKAELAQSISDTRNEIVHAKANYTYKGKECPDAEKECFGEMLKIISIQVIRWFSNIHEDHRITS